MLILFLVTATWLDVSTRRRYFDDYAKRHKFDPKVPGNWYTHHPDKIFGSKVLDFIFNYFLLAFCSPSFLPIGMLLMHTQGSSKILLYHGYSLSKALQDLFPDVQFDARQFMN